MTAKLKQYWDEKLKLTNTIAERKPRPAADIDLPLDDAEVDDNTIYNFLDELHPCEEASLHYLGDAILAGTVAFPSQCKKFFGAKNFRTSARIMGAVVLLAPKVSGHKVKEVFLELTFQRACVNVCAVSQHN